jgi:hypothetical protein
MNSIDVERPWFFLVEDDDATMPPKSLSASYSIPKTKCDHTQDVLDNEWQTHGIPNGIPNEMIDTQYVVDDEWQTFDNEL